MPLLEQIVFHRAKMSMRLPGKDCQLNISAIFSLRSLESPETARLQEFLQSCQDINSLEDIVEAQNFPFGNSLKLFIVNYLVLVRDFNPWSLLQSIDLMLSYYRNLTRCFENKDLTNILQQTLIDSTEYLIPLITKTDTKLGLVNQHYKKFTRLEFFTELLLSTFNKVIISKTVINENLISYLAIKIMRIYFLLDKPRLCNNILTNLKNLGLKFDTISASNKINYKFLVGKFYFMQENFMKAFEEFENCFKMLSLSVVSVRHVIIILRYLIPSALIVGRRPNFGKFAKIIETVQQKTNSYKGTDYDVLNLYQTIFKFMKRGDLNSVHAFIYQHEHTLKAGKIAIPLIQRTRVITLRNLIYKIYSINGDFAKNTLTFDSIQIGLRTSIGDEEYLPKYYRMLLSGGQEITVAMVESILINLIDQQLIKAIIFSRLKLVRFSKTNSFPNVYEVYNTRF